MAGGIGQVWGNAFENFVLRGTAMPAITPSIALFTANPTDTTAGTEVTYTGYVRQTASTSNFGTSSAGTATNSATVSYAQYASGANIVITGFAIMDAATGGNVAQWGPLSSNYTLTASTTPSFSAGALVLSLV